MAIKVHMIKENIRIALLQLDLVWESPELNRAKVDQFLDQLSKDTDVVFLPEMFTTGFTMNVTEYAEPVEGETIRWMKKRSRDHLVALCGSLITKEAGLYFNRLVFVEPSGETHFYDKRHLFTMGNEGEYFTKGTSRLIVQYQGWRICPLICYDLRFPVWSRNRNEYDLLVYVANWPHSREDVWNTLLKARALENQAYVAGVNRVGADGQMIAYSGNSQIVSPKGQSLDGIHDNEEGIISAELSWTELVKFRSTFPVLDDADTFYLE